MVTHSIEDLFDTCDRVAVLRAGRLASLIPVTRSRVRDLMAHAGAGEVHS
jgi:ABC-type sugar transport system ATPase subunit